MVERILVIEDDEDIADIVAVNLRQEGYEVEVALNGTSGINLAREEDFDLILCDIVMPDVDGYQVCRTVKALESVKQVPFIFLTALTGVEDKVAGLEAGADDFLTKPFDFGELVARISMNLDRAANRYFIDPITGFPGNTAADDALRRKVLTDEQFALLFIGLKGLRAYRTVYGDAKLEELLRFTAGVLREVIGKVGSKRDFVSFLGRGAFCVLTRPDRAGALASGIIRLFDEGISGHYAVGDLERGSIVTFDRRGGIVDNPLITVSIGGASNAERRIGSHWEAAEIASEVLDYVMTLPGSVYVMDRRTNGKKQE